MEDTSPYDELALRLVAELKGIGKALGPMVVNELRGEMAVLNELARADGPLSPGELSASAHVSSARVANILRSLEEKGLVTRSHSARDRRAVEVALTDAGRSLAESRRRAALAGLASTLGELGDRDASELVRIVGRLRSAIEGRVEGASA